MIPSGQLPAHLQGYESENNEALITSTLVLPRISLRGKQFRFRKDDKEKALPLGAPLRVVILGATPRKGCSKIYYDDPYQEGSDEPPACSSAGGQKPDSWILTPMSPNCATCPKNEWGSGQNSAGESTRGKACADTKQLLVVPPDQPYGDIWMIRVPPASLKLLSNYGYKLQQHKIPIEGVVTEISFIDAEYPKIDFNYFGFTSDQYGTKFIERVKSFEFKELIDKLSMTTPVDNQQVEAETRQQSAPAQTPVAQPPAEKEKIEEILWGDDSSESNQQVAQQPSTQQTSSNQAQPAGSAPAQNPQQPSGGVQAPDGSYYVSPAGETFDATKHATQTGCVAGALKQDGSFKAKRGTANTSVETKPQQQPTVAEKTPPSVFDTTDNQQSNDNEELQSILDQWGS